MPHPPTWPSTIDCAPRNTGRSWRSSTTASAACAASSPRPTSWPTCAATTSCFRAGIASASCSRCPDALRAPAADCLIALMRDRDFSTKILLIEDDVGLGEFMQYQMEREGYDVRTAHHGEEGLRLAQQWQPHLVVLDIMLPEMDGWAVCKGRPEPRNGPSTFTPRPSPD